MLGRSRMYALINKLIESAMLDEMHMDAIDSHDKIFQPKNIYEKKLWEACRQLTKKQEMKVYLQIKGGKKGGRPKKTIDIEIKK